MKWEHFINSTTLFFVGLTLIFTTIGAAIYNLGLGLFVFGVWMSLGAFLCALTEYLNEETTKAKGKQSELRGAWFTSNRSDTVTTDDPKEKESDKSTP